MTKPFKKPVKKYATGKLVTTDKKLTTGSKGLSTTSSRSEKPVYGGREGARQIGKDAKDLATRGKDLTTGSKGMSTTSSRSVGATRPEQSSTMRNMKDVAGERVLPSKLSGSESSAGTKLSGSNASKMGAKGAGLAALLYSKEAGKDSDFKGTDKRPEAFRDTDTFTPSARTQTVKPTTVENKTPSAMRLSKIGAENETTSAKPTMKSAPTSKYRGGRSEEDINRMIAESTPDRMKTAQPEIDRMAASARAEKLREDNPGMKRGGAVKSKAKSTCMKTGGMVKSSGASRGDGCAIKGRTKGRMV
jgi:hypothetical protein